MPEAEDEPWRSGRSWIPQDGPARWPPLVAAMLPCGAGVFVLGHLVRSFPLPLEVVSFLAVVLGCSAPPIVTAVTDRWAARFDEGVAAPPRGMALRCAALALGAVAAAFFPPAIPLLCFFAFGYEAAALTQLWRTERRSRPLR